MLKWLAIAVMYISVFVAAPAGFARDKEWPEGGPGYIYVTPTVKAPIHMPYDEGMQCVGCHRWDGADAYTSATMSLKKSTVGRLPREDIRQAILEALKGKEDYRQMYAMATSFNDGPLATCLEFTLDPETLTLYASSEKQTEKLFHLAANPRVSLVYVRSREDMRYFVDPLGVQIVGKAVLLKYGDPGFDEAAALCLETVRNHMTEELKSRMSPEAMLATIRRNQLITQVIPERIVVTSGNFVKRGLHRMQIWEAQAP